MKRCPSRSSSAPIASAAPRRDRRHVDEQRARRRRRAPRRRARAGRLRPAGRRRPSRSRPRRPSAAAAGESRRAPRRARPPSRRPCPAVRVHTVTSCPARDQVHRHPRAHDPETEEGDSHVADRTAAAAVRQPLSAPGSRREPEAVRDRRRLGAAAHVELGEDPRDVDARGLLGHEELLADLAVRAAARRSARAPAARAASGRTDPRPAAGAGGGVARPASVSRARTREAVDLRQQPRGAEFLGGGARAGQRLDRAARGRPRATRTCASSRRSIAAG